MTTRSLLLLAILSTVACKRPGKVEPLKLTTGIPKPATLAAVGAAPEKKRVATSDKPAKDCIATKLSKVDSGVPVFEVANTCPKKVLSFSAAVYAYDDSGKQLSRTVRSNTSALDAGVVRDEPLGSRDTPAPAGAKKHEAVVYHVAFADGSPPWHDEKVAPENRGPGGVYVDPRKQGDRIQVYWQGDCYAAVILKVVKPLTYYVTYPGYGAEWNETIGAGRICGK